MSATHDFAPESTADRRVRHFLSLPPADHSAMLAGLEAFAAEREAQAAAIRDHLAALRAAASTPLATSLAA